MGKSKIEYDTMLIDMNTRYDIEKYISDVNEIYNSGVPTEHTYRVPLVNLLAQLLRETRRTRWEFTMKESVRTMVPLT